MLPHAFRTGFQHTARTGNGMVPRTVDTVQRETCRGKNTGSLEKLLQPAPAYVYRFHMGDPRKVFETGFQARDACPLDTLGIADIDTHVTEPGLAKRRHRAAFISTSTDKAFCRNYGLGFLIHRAITQGNPQEKQALQGFLYKISGQDLHGFDINAILPRNHRYAGEREFAFHKHIPTERIIKAKSLSDRMIIRNRHCAAADDPDSSDDEYIDAT